MLKGLILSGAIVLAWAIFELSLLRARRPRSALKLMAASFAPAIPLFLVVHMLTPATLGFLPMSLSATPLTLALLNGLLLLLLFFVTCVQFYYHFHNSITLRLLAEFKQAPQESMTMNQIEARYGVPILLDERFHVLEKTGLTHYRQGRYYPSALGLLAAAAARGTGAILKLRP